MYHISCMYLVRYCPRQCHILYIISYCTGTVVQYDVRYDRLRTVLYTHIWDPTPFTNTAGRCIRLVRYVPVVRYSRTGTLLKKKTSPTQILGWYSTTTASGTMQ